MRSLPEGAVALQLANRRGTAGRIRSQQVCDRGLQLPAQPVLAEQLTQQQNADLAAGADHLLLLHLGDGLVAVDHQEQPQELPLPADRLAQAALHAQVVAGRDHAGRVPAGDPLPEDVADRGAADVALQDRAHPLFVRVAEVAARDDEVHLGIVEHHRPAELFGEGVDEAL